MTVSALDDAADPAAENLFDWYDRVRIPQLLTLPGVAGSGPSAATRQPLKMPAVRGSR